MSNSAINAAICHIALSAARASQIGNRTYRPEWVEKPQSFDLRTGAMCLRFVRQCIECATDTSAGNWHYAMAKAKQALRMMEADGAQVGDSDTAPSTLKIGDIIGITTGVYGHIAIFMGLIDCVYSVAENTSSGSRGNPLRPGTKLTPYALLRNRVTGIFRLYPTEEKHVKVTVEDKTKEINIPAKMIDGVIYVPVRNISQALGHEINYDNKTGEATVKR